VVAHYQVTGFGETHESLGYLILALPNGFPSHEEERSLDYWFSVLLCGVESVVAKTADEQAATLLEIVKTICTEAREMYKGGDIKAGRLRLQDADDWFSEVGRHLKSRPRTGNP